MVKKSFKYLYLGLVLLLLYAPILLLAVYSFIDTDIIGSTGGFTFRHYTKLFTEPALRNMIINTVVLALVVATLSTIIGTCGAIGMFYSKKRTARLVNTASQIPVINAEIVTALSLAVMFVVINIESSYFTLVVGQMVLCTPFVVLSIIPKLKQMNNNLYEAALDLGASPTRALFKVVIPQIMPGILSGFMLAITLSLDDYIITTFTKPTTFDTISTYVYNAIYRGSKGAATTLSSFWALSTLIFLIVVVFVIVINIRSSKNKEAK